MMPMKNASSDMKSAASPRKETTRLSALATGLRLMTTAAPKISIKAAAIQKKMGDIGKGTRFPGSGFRVQKESCGAGSPLKPCNLPPVSFHFVPFQHQAVHHAADLDQLLFVVHHLLTGVAGNSVIFAQENRLLRTNLFAHAAVDAADHVDVELLGIFFHFGKP